MAFAMLVSTITGTADSCPPSHEAEDSSPSISISAFCAGGVALLLMIVALVLSFLGRHDNKRIAAIAELCSGLSFGAGLLLSGMARPKCLASWI